MSAHTPAGELSLPDWFTEKLAYLFTDEAGPLSSAPAKQIAFLFTKRDAKYVLGKSNICATMHIPDFASNIVSYLSQILRERQIGIHKDSNIPGLSLYMSKIGNLLMTTLPKKGKGKGKGGKSDQASKGKGDAIYGAFFK